MKKNRTIGKRQVMDAARARGLGVARGTDPEDGKRRWKITNHKGLTVWRESLWEVWLVVRPRPIKLPEEVTTNQTNETKEEQSFTTEDTEHTEEEEVGE